MELRLKIEPFIHKGRIREEALKSLYETSFVSGGGPNYRYSGVRAPYRDDKIIIVYNLVKHKKKTKQNRWKTNDKNSKDPRIGKYKNSEILHKKEWTAYVYRIPIEVIKLLGVEIIQNSRNFTIKSKK